MAFPEVGQIRQAIGEELQATGGQAYYRQLFPGITARLRARFPDFTDADLRRTDPGHPNVNSWEHRIHTVRSMMVKTQPPELDPQSPRGIWRLPQSGTLPTVSTGVSPTPSVTPPPPPLPNEVTKVAEQITALVATLLQLAQRSQSEPVHTHSELINIGKQIGQTLGKVVETESGPVYKHDVSWKDNKYKLPSLVIEVCDKGNLDKDIQALNWASQNWGAKGIIVIVDDKDYQNALNKLPTGGSVFAIKAADFAKLYSVLGSAGKEILKLMFGV